MKNIYRIQIEKYDYTYRSYMACEDKSAPDCVDTNYFFVVYKGNRKLKKHYSIYDAKLHLRRLKKRAIK